MGKKSAIIIGGGFAGLSAAVFLDALGYQITLLEKKPILGGRAYSFKDKKTNSWIDNGQHLMMGAYHETLKFLENIGAKRFAPLQKKTRVPLLSKEGILNPFCLPALPAPLNLLVGLLKMKSSLREKFSFLKLGLELKRLKKNKSSVSMDITVDEWLKKMNQSDKIRTDFWEPLTLATLNDNPKVASAKMLTAVLVKGFLGKPSDAKMILPQGNLNELLANPAHDYLKIRGQTIKLGCGVKKINILDETVREIELDNGEVLKADLYISAVPFSTLLRIVPETYVNNLSYFNNIKKLKSSPIVSINLWFDKEIFNETFIGTANKKIHWYFCKNRITSENKTPFHYMAVVSGAYDFIELSREEIMEIVLKEIKELFPDSHTAQLLHSLVNKEREATLSVTIDSEILRPNQQSPFANFYIVGDWTKTGLPATIESAVLSAQMAVNAIKNT